ncbi:MAG: T9SS type A sorting domain-containing protein [Bacteroidetes bacterium]|nr:T9SS type A sorting domain-containing protein [Bacteroidota bacterium]
MKTKLITLAFFFFNIVIHCNAQSLGPESPASVVYGSAGCLSCPGSTWNSTSDAKSEDGKFATVGLASPYTCFQNYCYYSRYLISTDFSFAIPSGATVLGIKAEVKGKADSLNSINDTIVQLTKNGGTTGSANRGTLSFIDSLNKYYSYGGTTDLWGFSWTPAEINSAAFGLILSYKNKSANGGVVNLDNIQITVTYSIASGIEYQTSAISNFAAYQESFENLIGLSFEFSKSAVGELYLYNTAGECRINKNLGLLAEGKHAVSINISGIAAGVYFIKLASEKGVLVKKIIIL